MAEFETIRGSTWEIVAEGLVFNKPPVPNTKNLSKSKKLEYYFLIIYLDLNL